MNSVALSYWVHPEAELGDVAVHYTKRADVSEREGSRIAVVLFDEVHVFHRPHPSPKTDKGAVVSVKKWLEQHGVKP